MSTERLSTVSVYRVSEYSAEDNIRTYDTGSDRRAVKFFSENIHNLHSSPNVLGTSSQDAGMGGTVRMLGWATPTGTYRINNKRTNNFSRKTLGAASKTNSCACHSEGCTSSTVERLGHVFRATFCITLTFWRRNFFLNFSTPCI